MGKGSTQVQHLVETEVPPRLLENWLEIWREHYGFDNHYRVQLRPHTAGSELLELAVFDDDNNKIADVIFSTILDRMGKTFISIRDQNTFDTEYRQKRLMALLHIFLIHRYKAVAVHYVSPTEDNQMQTKGMQKHGIFGDVHMEVGDIIAAEVNPPRIAELLKADNKELTKFIQKKKTDAKKATKKKK
jgi:isocitrate lyase